MRKTMRGFTLIEIMLVIVIIGCATGIIVLSIPGGPSPKLGNDLAEESQQLAATIQVMSEQATQQGRTIGLHISDHGYQFMIRQQTTAANDDTVTQSTSQALDTLPDWDHQVWQPYTSEKLRTAGEFDEKVSLALTLDGLQLQEEENRLGRSNPQWFDTENQLEAKTPQILLLPSGEITPFSLTLEELGSNSTLYRQIKGQENGQITVLNEPEDNVSGGHS
ncbi:general secretion pathway protein H [Tolumonas auensis DSM 9187]|uniref:Type II secretion system protein H n=1 Tax=Tolumonas auensis (strain DSM 9187 / NBRC 110442 / TA 4) TaxID=595494 RepID=C4L994_TOLAT|nr:type II secretion system minor pseudopilin GspH [Tolumonas auensis]ACQ91993.1 general secretion pathway protein H [Tolumonas auensis DSM 9187]